MRGVGLRAWVGVRVHGVTRTPTGLWHRTHKEHDMGNAKYEVRWKVVDVPIAWFTSELDATEFVKSQVSPDFYEIRPL